MKIASNYPRLTVVGAGPGDPDLITIKAVKALSTADVVLYDALIDTSLLEYVPKKAERIYVGKRKGCYAYAQDQINELIVDRAHKKGHVVRLKGGDPFVFGRGMEELEYAAAHGLGTAFVPGMSSALSVPGFQGIPMTHRGVAESFWVITGTTSDHSLSADLALAAQSTATVVVLMGMSKLEEITAQYARLGKEELPVAIIQDGTTLNERIITGRVNTIAQRAREQRLSNPAVIILGEVVECRSRLQQLYHQARIQQAVTT